MIVKSCMCIPYRQKCKRQDGEHDYGRCTACPYDCDIDADKVNVPISYRNRSIATRIREMIISLITARSNRGCIVLGSGCYFENDINKHKDVQRRAAREGQDEEVG